MSAVSSLNRCPIKNDFDAYEVVYRMLLGASVDIFRVNPFLTQLLGREGLTFYFYFQFFKIKSSFSETRRPIATKFCRVIGSCCSFDPSTSDFPYLHHP